MGCKISQLPKDIEESLKDQKSNLETIYESFQPMEEDIQSAIQKKKDNYIKIQEILRWKDESEKKIAKLEKILKNMQTGAENNSDDILVDLNSVEIEIEDQHEELLTIINELKSLS
jgi:DNA repair exonuclease SbcCD ATPase subunit